MVNAKGVYANARGSDLRSPHRAVRATNEKIKKKKKIAINTNLPLFTHCICNNNVGASGQSKKDDETSCLVFFFYSFFYFFFRGLPKESVNWYVLHIVKAWPRANLTFDVVSRLAILLLTKRRPVGNTYIVGAGGKNQCRGAWVSGVLRYAAAVYVSTHVGGKFR